MHYVFTNLSISFMSLSPGLHHEGIVDRDTHNLVDALGFDVPCRGHIA